jgi:hypothetical protein
MPYRPELKGAELADVAESLGLEPGADIDAISAAIAAHYEQLREPEPEPPES